MECVNFTYKFLGSKKPLTCLFPKSPDKILYYYYKVEPNEKGAILTVISEIIAQNSGNNHLIVGESYYLIYGIKGIEKLSQIGYDIVAELTYQHLAIQYDIFMPITHKDSYPFTIPTIRSIYDAIKVRDEKDLTP